MAAASAGAARAPRSRSRSPERAASCRGPSGGLGSDGSASTPRRSSSASPCRPAPAAARGSPRLPAAAGACRNRPPCSAARPRETIARPWPWRPSARRAAPRSPTAPPGCRRDRDPHAGRAPARVHRDPEAAVLDRVVDQVVERLRDARRGRRAPMPSPPASAARATARRAAAMPRHRSTAGLDQRPAVDRPRIDPARAAVDLPVEVVERRDRAARARAPPGRAGRRGEDSAWSGRRSSCSARLSAARRRALRQPAGDAIDATTISRPASRPPRLGDQSSSPALSRSTSR